MKFLVCIFIFTFCLFTEAQSSIPTSLNQLIEMYAKSGDIYPSPLRIVQAEQGDVETQLAIAGVYFRQHSALKKNTKVSLQLQRSLYWFKKAAKQGNPEAQTILGAIYCCSDSWNFRAEKGFFFKKPLVYKSYPTALEWFEKAAEQGNSEAQHQIAVIKNELEAREELRENGNKGS